METSDSEIQMWKFKKILQFLDNCNGNGTSLISLIINPNDQLYRFSKLITEEYSTATNIKSRVNKQSVLSALKSLQQKLKLYNKIPENGLALFCGTIILNSKDKQVIYDIQLPKQINTSIYKCDSRFYTDPLRELLIDEKIFGFIIIDGNGTLFGTLSGNVKTILEKIHIDLPKKQRKGGQSAQRFGRIRLEKRNNYIKIISENSIKHFISDNLLNVNGIIIAGSAEFKDELKKSETFDPRIKSKILSLVDISYGFENGFNEAIRLSENLLGNLKYIEEIKLLTQFNEEIAKNTGKYCYGLENTMKNLESGVISKLILYEDLDILKTEVEVDSIKQIFYLKPNDPPPFNEFGINFKILSNMPLTEFCADNYKSFGCDLFFISNCSNEGSQFVQGFGGIGGLTRFIIDFKDEELEEEEFDSDVDFI